MARQMKDSGIEWIGEIPATWGVRKLKNVADIIRGGSPRPIDAYLTDSAEGYNWIKIGDTQKGYKYIDRTKQKIIADGAAKSRIVHKGDLLLTNSMSFGEPYILNVDGCIHDGWVSFTNYKDISIDFLYYFLSSPLCFIQFQKQVDGGVVQNLNIDKVGSTIVFVPPTDEQHRIADFLDRQCAEIDAVVERTKATIEEYKKLKQAVITEAVTKGVRGARKMKDSGIEWIGEIPEEWSIRKLFRAIDAIGDIDHYMPESVETGIPYLMTGDLRENVSKVCFELCKQVSCEDYMALSAKIKANQGDVIFARYATIGTVCYVDVDKEFLVSYSCLTIKPTYNLLLGKFLFYYLKSTTFYEDVRQYINSNTQANVGLDSMTKAKIVLPSVCEQEEIISYLDEKCAALDTLITKKIALLTELETYKKSLIYEYVTGKKEVTA